MLIHPTLQGGMGILDFGFWILDFRLVIRHLSFVIRHSSFVIGKRVMVFISSPLYFPCLLRSRLQSCNGNDFFLWLEFSDAIADTIFSP